VAASRARLGFFILGSTAAVEKSGSGVPVKHWSNLLEHLRTPRPFQPSRPAESEDDSASFGALGDLTSGCRVGSTLTLCCPRHRETSKIIRSSNDFPQDSSWRTFCCRPCTLRLDWCHHSCGLTCHSSQKQPHSSPEDCAHPLNRPCPDHETVPLPCGSLYRTSILRSGRRSFEEAFEAFLCDQPVKYARPECAHEVNLLCHERAELLSPKPGGFALELCTKIVADFVSGF